MNSSQCRRTFSTLLLATVAFALMAQRPFAIAQGQVDVLIAFTSVPGPSDEALVRAAGGTVKHTFHLVPAIAASVPDSALDGLRRNPRVARVEPDVRVYAIDAELDNSWGVKRIGAGSVHASGNRGSGVSVAVIDSGVDYNHPDLASNYAGGYDFVNNDGEPLDDNKHGTHVAGTIAALDNDAGVVGVAPAVALYALKVLGADGSGSFSNVIAALQWAVDHGIQITNSSFGSSQNPGLTVQAAYDNAAAAGLLHVAAAGNSGTCDGTGDNVLYPARYASVIAVAATDSANSSPCFSSTGPDVELAAPGVSINSTVPGGTYEVLSGTSMASPHVAGTAALVINAGVSDTNGNGRVNDEVRQRLIETAQDLGTAGRDTWYGYGIVDAVAAVAPAAPKQPSVVVAVTTDKATYTSGVDAAAQVTAVVTDENGNAIAGLASSAFATALDGGAIGAVFAETTAGRYSATVDISGTTAGTHTVVVSATDTRGLSGSGTATFNVAPPNVVRVAAVNYSTWGGQGGKRNLLISVAIVDGVGTAVNGATVSVIVTRNGVYYGAANGVSNSAGNALFEARNAPSGCYETTVAAVIAGSKVWDEVTPANSFCK